jgi:hypothetical protein
MTVRLRNLIRLVARYSPHHRRAARAARPPLPCHLSGGALARRRQVRNSRPHFAQAGAADRAGDGRDPHPCDDRRAHPADSSCELIQLSAAIAAHHERWDGGGYPHGLKQQEIPIAARVVAVADAFDALTTRWPYKEPMPLAAARDYLVDNSGRQFDPA